MSTTPRPGSGHRFLAILAGAGLWLGAASCSESGQPGPRADDNTAIASESLTAVLSQPPDCTASLQTLVDAASSGAELLVPGCVYRETVHLTKPIALKGAGAAEIRGSDIWIDWRHEGGYWIQGKVPAMSTHGRCIEGPERCRWPEQVFIDGRPLLQVAVNPRSGEFAVTSARDVLLADDPTGRLVEVTTRRHWVIAQSDQVTIEGFTMKHAGTRAQAGAITNDGYNRLVLRRNTLSEGHAALVSLDGGSGHRIEDNVLRRGGQEGLHITTSRDITVQGNTIVENNTEGFDPGWEAGGLKAATGVSEVTVTGNEVAHNRGAGIWFDIRSRDVRITANRVHHNSHLGIFFEISSHAEIAANRVWENGYASPGWGQGAGIMCHTCSHTAIRGNLVAWNADGITVQVQDRPDAPGPPVEITIEENLIAMTDDPADRDRFALGWLQDYPGPLFLPQSRNRGRANRYYYPAPEGCCDRFSWGNRPFRSLADFVGTPGGQGDRYLTEAERASLLLDAGIPLSAERP